MTNNSKNVLIEKENTLTHTYQMPDDTTLPINELLKRGLMRCWSCHQLRTSADGDCNRCGADEFPF